jgi:alpha-mannosidase
MDWNDRQKAAIDFMDKDARISIVEQGPVRVTVKVERKGQNSEIVQYYSLSAGEAGKRFEVANTIDWQSREVSLKASFPLAVSNENATYNLGAGTIARGNNDPKKFEVPSKEWFDLTDKSGKYGVTILEDCKFGSDKPDNNTLRLTLMYTPKSTAHGGWFIYQSTQDWGIHDMKYAVYGHAGDWAKAESPWQAKFFNQPLIAFEAPKHAGELGQSFSSISINNPQVGLMAFKKMENDDYYVVRVNELSGKDLKGVKISFPAAVAEAFEVNGQEQRIGNATVSNGQLQFDLSHYTLRSFAVKLKSIAAPAKIEQAQVALPYNVDVITFDANRWDGVFGNGQSIPAELLPEVVQSEDIRFAIANKTDEQNNAVSCAGQTINLPKGNYNKLYLLAAAVRDTKADFVVDGKTSTLDIQQWTGYVGQHYNRILSRDRNSVVDMEKPYTKTDNIAWFASHCHNEYPMKNEAYQYCYLYKYEIQIPAGAKTITLPKSNNIKVLGATVANQVDELKPVQPLYDDLNNNPQFTLRNK